MKIPTYSLQKTEIAKKDLPACFQTEVRTDLVKKLILALRANSRQPYGADPTAGKKQGAKLSRRRRDFKTSYGLGISRAPRKVLARRGTRFTWVGAFSAGSVGGKAAHPPKAEKNWKQKINKKEKKKAMQSLLTASLKKNLVESNGHIVPEHYPFIIETKFEELAKTKDVVAALVKLGFSEELERAERKKMRTGRGKMRGRTYKKAKGPLIVVSGKCKLLNAAKSIPGIDITAVQYLNGEMLAPSIKPGRLTLFTEAAIEKIAKEKLFM
ncbi:MAG: 50S ribosomal protein L4 [Candidatus Woesearchaeota archaeon]|jgi:large subunit ribosomal protein L4e